MKFWKESCYGFVNMYDIGLSSFQCIYMFIRGHVAQYRKRSCNGDLSITFTIALALFPSMFLCSLKTFAQCL